MRKLALDYGTKNCGFAITDEMCVLASGIENFTYANNDLQAIVNRIEYWQKFYENKIDTLIIGFPTNARDGSYNERSILVLQFKKYLEEHWQTPISIVLFDERFSTKIATEYLKFQAKLKSSQIKKIKDKMSAVVILNDYLNTLK